MDSKTMKQDVKSSSDDIDFDVLIIGAGMSGINAAHRIQTEAPRGTTYAILEARSSIGGTWDLFRYPGIRSDSDMFTYGFSWNPWPKKETLASGAEIKKYVIASAQSAGIAPRIRYRHKIISSNWSSSDRLWETIAVVEGEEKHKTFRSRFIMLGTGYYDYDQPLQTVIPGIENFQGKVIHPQFWPEDYDYTDKEVVVIGSGATAISIVPAMAEKAKHVTMLQRSPTYVFPLAQHGKLAAVLFALLPIHLAQRAIRLSWILFTYLTVTFCRRRPNIARRHIQTATKRLLPSNVPCDPHFTPAYNPWEQRLCAAQDGDIFAALRSGKAGIETDTIEMITENSIQLKSGKTLHPDIIVTATGLQLKHNGGIKFTIDHQKIDTTQKFVWNACMIQDLPNVLFNVGFENASWTLGSDCAATLLTRLLREAKARNAQVVVPYLEYPEKMEVKPMMTLKATYLKNIHENMPKGGSGVWSPRSNYLKDMYKAKWGSLQDGLIFK